jgi:acyl-CoA synthetase (AMP-forming)/AMP-acid ligase II
LIRGRYQEPMLVLNNILDQAEARYGSQVAIATHGLQLTYSELLSRSRRLAAALSQKGVVPGDRVAILARNSFRYLEVNFACVMLGAILAPLNVRLAKPEIAAIVARTDCSLAFCGDPFHIDGVPNISWDDARGPIRTKSPRSFLPVAPRACPRECVSPMRTWCVAPSIPSRRSNSLARMRGYTRLPCFIWSTRSRYGE